MKLSPEKETFMTDLISGCIKSFSLISFNQMSWKMNKKHTGKKWWNLRWTYPHGGTIDANAWEKEYLPEFHAKLKRAFIKALYEVKNPASQIVAVFRKSQQSRTLQFVFFFFIFLFFKIFFTLITATSRLQEITYSTVTSIALRFLFFTNTYVTVQYNI